MCIVLSALIVFLNVNPVQAPATFSVQASPQTLNLSRATTLTVSVAGTQANQLYNLTVTVTKPDGTSVSSTGLQVLSDFLGSGSASVRYPADSWADLSGTPHNTDQVGPYSVVVDKLSPNPPEPGATTTSFNVVSTLYVTVQSPTNGTVLTRGAGTSITAYVADYNSVPVTSATVTATSPTSTVSLPHIGGGSYSRVYEIPLSEVTGSWTMRINASMAGNAGTASITVAVLFAQLVASDLSTHDSDGLPASEFSSGNTVHASLRVLYSSGNMIVTSGSFNIQVKNPSGAVVGTILATYDSNRGRFYTSTGFAVPSSGPEGAWQLVIATNSLNDTYGNSGPALVIAQSFRVQLSPATAYPFYFGLVGLALASGLAGLVFLKRFNKSNAPFERLFQLTGGEVEPPATLMIIGDPGAGASTLGLQLAYQDLLAGRSVGLLSYDAFPSEIQKKLQGIGCDITSYLEKGHFRMLDCYSSLAGIEGGIQDPTDFTEVSIQVTGILEKSKGTPTVLLDSIAPIFNAAAAKDCINFLQVIGAKVKNSGGKFIFIASRGSIPEEARSKTEALADGLFDLSLKKRAGSTARFLTVKKMPNRHVSISDTEFEIAPGKGILFKKQRIPVRNIFKPA